jgi:hypothetical protein
MGKKLIIVLLCCGLLSTCGSVKPASDKCCKEKTQVVSINKDPLMGILVSALIIYSIKILFAR